MTKKRIIIIIVVSLILLGSVGTNGYFFGWKKLVFYYRQQGFNIAVNYIIGQIEKTGQVQINNDLILIKK